ncbi:MAG: alpha/beta hydrolase-fold protein [Fibrobacterota bacterium]|nr:alpha/beta hydrolase-fold protein [Fibrobacterota bacterium]
MSKLVLFTVVTVIGLWGWAEAAPISYKDFEARTHKISSSQSLPYRLFKPKGYSPANKYAIMVTLHGAGERGTDDSLQLKFQFGLMWADSVNQAIRPCFVLAPQCPPDPHRWVNRPWDSGTYDFSKVPISTSLEAVMNILDSLGREFSLDTDRFYVSGMSMGGYGSWYLLMKYPTKFAAAVPVCGGADPKTASSLKGTPIWAFHSADDGVVPVSGSRDIINQIQAEGGNPKYTEYPASLNYGHNA